MRKLKIQSALTLSKQDSFVWSDLESPRLWDSEIMETCRLALKVFLHQKTPRSSFCVSMSNMPLCSPLVEDNRLLQVDRGSSLYGDGRCSFYSVANVVPSPGPYRDVVSLPEDWCVHPHRCWGSHHADGLPGLSWSSQWNPMSLGSGERIHAMFWSQPLIPANSLLYCSWGSGLLGMIPVLGQLRSRS